MNKNDLADEQKEQWLSIRDRRDDKFHDQRNVMLQVVMTFLGVALPLYKERSCVCMGWAIAFACITALMLFIAQRKLTRQMKEVIDAYPVVANKNIDMLNPTQRWYEELCIKCWGIPFVLMVVSCFIAVFL